MEVDTLDLLVDTKRVDLVVLVVLVTTVLVAVEQQHQIAIPIDKVIQKVVLVANLLMMDSVAVELVDLVEAHLVTVVVVTVD